MYEKVNPSHPDKLADRIAGALVDLAYAQVSDPRIAVEVLLGQPSGSMSVASRAKQERQERVPSGKPAPRSPARVPRRKPSQVLALRTRRSVTCISTGSLQKEDGNVLWYEHIGGRCSIRRSKMAQ